VAIVRECEVLAELTWRSGQNHSVELLPHLSNLLNQVGLDLQSASGIIVAKGPGSFNGLRVGISTAKGLALSLGIPIVGVSTLEVAAYPYAETGLPICPMSDAGRVEIATAMYQKQGKTWCQLSTEQLTTIEALCSQITTPTIFCGEFVSAISTLLKGQLGDLAVIPGSASRLRRASFLAELGLQQLKTGYSDNPATMQPIYLRRPLITQPKHR
jgi:tRNA threonylcarbamoyl adenosine modification protein YeaZ